MAKGTLTREEIRESVKEDEFSDALKRFVSFIQKHSRTLILVLVVLIAAVAAWKVMEYRNTKAIENSSLQLNQAQQKYSQAVFDPQIDPAKRGELLDQAVATLDGVRRAYSGTPSARLALYLQGNAYLAKRDKPDSTENIEKARETFRQYADTAASKEDKARGLLGLAAAYENLGWIKNDTADYQKAEETYREVIGSMAGDSYLTLDAKLSLARLLASRGETAKAADLYREVIKAAGTEPEAAEEPALTAAERQRRQFEKAVRGILNQYTYGKVAEEELNQLVPPSAKTLNLQVPGLSADKPSEKLKAAAKDAK